MLAQTEAAFRFRLSSWMLKGVLLAYVTADLALLAAALGWRLTLIRAFR